MKVLACLCLLAVCAYGSEVCVLEVAQDCAQGSTSLSMPSCNAVYGGYGRHGNVASEMAAYANLHLERSYEYLLSASFFNNYQKNRVGFSKLFKKLSDEAWAKTIDIIKHITMRGGKMDFSQRSIQKPQERKNYTVEVNELPALAKALDTQKELAERAFYIHKEATRDSQHLHDPEISQYLEEEFIEDHAQTIRNIAGYTRDLKSFITANNGQDLSISVYLFDEYLQKVV